MNWDPATGEKASRSNFSHTTVHWDPDFKRDDGPGKEYPVALVDTPYWERTT